MIIGIVDRHRKTRGAARQRGFVGPVLVVLLLLVSALLWLVSSSSGAAFALRLGVAATGEGTVRDVRGSFWSGLRIGTLEYRSAALDLRAEDLRLQVDWRALRDRRVDVRRIGARSLHLDLHAGPEKAEPEATAGAPGWPQLPGSVIVRELAVGSFGLSQDGVEVPVRLEDVAANLAAGPDGARLVLDRLVVRGPDAGASIRGAASLGAGDPMAVTADLALDVEQGERSAQLQVAARGTLEDLAIEVEGAGEGLEAQASARLRPFAPELPLTSLSAMVKGLDPAAWVPGAPAALLNLTASLQLSGALAPAPVEPAPGPETGSAAGDSADAASAAPTVAADPLARFAGLQAALDLTLDEGSRWQQQPLQGRIQARTDGLRVPELTVDVRAGRNQVALEGAVGEASDRLRFRLDLPQPDQLWAGLDTGMSGLAEGELRGLPAQHALQLKARLNLPRAWTAATPQVRTVAPGHNQVVDDDAPLDLPATLKQGPVDIDLALSGAWGVAAASATDNGRAGWRGSVERLQIRNPQVGLTLGTAVPVTVLTGGEAPLAWSVGQTNLRIGLPRRRSLVVQHAGSSGQGSQWRSAGRADGVVPAWLVAQLPRVRDPLQLDLAWDLAMTNTLAGTLDARRRAGDLAAPGEPPIPLELRTLALRAEAVPASGNTSNVTFSLDLAGRQFGQIAANGATAITVRNGVPELTPQQRIQADVKLAVQELDWISSFIGDDTEIGGKLEGALRFVREGGQWQASGGLNGSGLRVVRIDEGIRLLDGTLAVRVDSDRLIVESLRFPGVMRAVPQDSRVRAWLAEHGGKGYIEASGHWSLSDASGRAKVALSRFPLVQRADRFIAGSGNVTIEATPRRLDIDGDVVTDVGWISLEGASDLPSLDSDVVIVRAGDEPDRGEAMNLRMRLDVDLGKQFYLRGMGLDTALEGKINVRNTRSGLRANGVVNTREGRFSIYGQTLVVRHGSVTFQNQLDDPLLDVIAVRPHLRVEAGVQVSGTARAPIITLISYPDVPEVEKLSWLLLGRSPDASGADAGMLLAAAASLLTDDGSEPIYRQLGLDEMGLRSGEGTGVRGLLPDRTVVTSIDSSGESDAETQFLVVGKRLTDAVYLTFEQALSGRETVVRATYRLSESLAAIAQGGTLNGLRLVWSLVFDD